MNEIQKQIKEYLSFGWSLIPIIPETKEPAIKWKEFMERRASFEEIQVWLDKGWWLAVVTGEISGILIIDDDRVKHGLNEWGFDSSIVAKTKSGGKHYYRKWDREIHSHVNPEIRIDIKGWHSYCLLPSFNERVWINAPTKDSLSKLSPVSDEEVRLINSNKLNSDTSTSQRLNMEGFIDIEEGARTDSLYRLACSIFWRMNKEDGIRILIGVNNTYTPPLSRDEFEYQVTQAWNFVKESKQKNNKSESRNTYNNDKATNDKYKTLEIVTFQELRNTTFPPNKWIVKGLVAENGINGFSGKPKVGKSFTTLYLAICIATGRKFLGEFEVQKSNVLLISKEDSKRLINERINQITDEENVGITFCTDNQLFFDTNDYIDEVLRIVKENNIKVVIIDSFRRIFKGEENSSQVISEVHNRFKELTDKGLTIIFIHHHGKDSFFKKSNSEKLRGSSDILAMLDSLIIIDRKDSSTLKIIHASLRADKPLQPFIVSFPTFKNGDRNFQFQGFIDEEKDKKESAKDDILEFLQNNKGVNQKTIILALKEKIYGDTTIKDALKDLVEAKKIWFVPKGTEKIYSPFADKLESRQGEMYDKTD